MTDLVSASRLPLAGRTAVVTGSSSGIGRAIALELAVSGANVLVHARSSAAKAEEVAGQICSSGRKSGVELCDLADVDAQDNLVEAAWRWAAEGNARDTTRGVDIWVNNAGADVLTGPPAEWSFERKLEELWRVDVTASIRISRTVGGRMKACGSGVILNIGWDQAAVGMEGDSGEMFAAVKGAVAAFSRSLAQSLAPEVRVNCLAPGWIRTAWGASASDYWQERAQRDTLLARWGTPEDVARVARFLASDDGAFINGQVIDVNGGVRR